LEAVDRSLLERDEFILEVKDRLQLAQQVMRGYYDRTHRDIHYDVGDWVWLRLHHRQAASMAVQAHAKLAPKFYGPFQILERIGDVAYRLQLPASARIHDVFHVSLLKKFHGEPPKTTPDLPPISHGRAIPTPAKVVRARKRRGEWEVLVHWQGLAEVEATWEQLQAFRDLYPDVQLEDELFLQGGSNDVDAYWGHADSRRRQGNTAAVRQGKELKSDTAISDSEIRAVPSSPE
jgi:hypothetical protein